MKKSKKYYRITKLGFFSWARPGGTNCGYLDNELKGISSIVFKDDIGDTTELADYSQSSPTQSKPTIRPAPEKDTTPPSIKIEDPVM